VLVTAEPGRVSILLVDDQESNLVALEACLDTLGAELIASRSGEEALRELLVRDFAAILLDVQMPGMDGFETADLIRRRDRTRHVPILFLTAINKSDTHVMRGYALGAVDYMFKPIVPEILRSKVQVFIELFRKRERERFMVDALAQKTRELERKNAELHQFARTLATEIQEPLREIEVGLGRIETACSGIAPAETARVRGQAVRVVGVIEELLAQARAGSQPLAPVPTDLGAVFESVRAKLAEAIESSGASVTAAALPTVVADPEQLEQLLRAVITCALDARGEGTVALKLSAEREGSDWKVLLRVVPSSPQSDVVRILAPGAPQGATSVTALRLGMARTIVERHGGQIGSEVADGGLLIWFTVPSEG
jgi:CheY-like chemotaxis protein